MFSGVWRGILGTVQDDSEGFQQILKAFLVRFLGFGWYKMRYGGPEKISLVLRGILDLFSQRSFLSSMISCQKLKANDKKSFENFFYTKHNLV